MRMAEADSQTHYSTLQANRRQIRSAKTNRHQRLSNDHELVENVEKTNHMDNKSKFADPIFTSIATVIRVINLILSRISQNIERRMQSRNGTRLG